ncbi:hypothetical protein GC177_06635 [bacterium]|nr:hypothetical protein [bacterium]
MNLFLRSIAMLMLAFVAACASPQSGMDCPCAKGDGKKCECTTCHKEGEICPKCHKAHGKDEPCKKCHKTQKAD